METQWTNKVKGSRDVTKAPAFEVGRRIVHTGNQRANSVVGPASPLRSYRKYIQSKGATVSIRNRWEGYRRPFDSRQWMWMNLVTRYPPPCSPMSRGNRGSSAHSSIAMRVSRHRLVRPVALWDLSLLATSEAELGRGESHMTELLSRAPYLSDGEWLASASHTQNNLLSPP